MDSNDWTNPVSQAEQRAGAITQLLAARYVRHETPRGIEHGEKGMKTKLIRTITCVLVLLINRPASAFASSEPDATSIVVDVAVARPLTFALTILGSAAFVVSLPVAVPSGTVKKVAHTLVAVPAKDTFTRPVGDFDDFLE